MRTKESRPVFKNMGIAFDPPEAGTPSKAKRVFRNYYCKHTQQTKKITRQVYVTRGHDKDGKQTDIVRTSVIERSPTRPLSTGFHTLAEKQAEAAERATAWQALSLTDQLAALDKRPGESKKQRARIRAAISKAAVEAKNPPKPGAPKNQKQTTEEKVAKQTAHAQAVMKQRRNPPDKK